MNYYELISFILYFVVVIGIGIYFFVKSKTQSEKDYFLGGREMNGFVAALSAGASDMSAWCLMGLPGSIALYGMGKIWISIGLLIGTILAWYIVAPRLRRFAIKANDSITVPQFLTNRFKSSSTVLQVVCSIIFVIAYCVYTASSIFACGNLLYALTGGDISKVVGMIIFALIIVVYTLLGGFKAVCWTDFFQGMLMLAALMVLPIVGEFIVNSDNFTPLSEVVTNPNYYNLLSSGKIDWKSISDILTGLGWGLGYFGMPHILVRYISIKNEKEMKKSKIIGSCWTAIILLMATIFGLVAHKYLGNAVIEADNEMVFVTVARDIFKYGAFALIGGVLVSSIIAASMSTADSQLLASSSAFVSDFYKPLFNKNCDDKKMLKLSRIVVFAIAIIALFIAIFFSNSGIMGLVSAAWSIFGAAFGPAILLALYWKRVNYKGTVAGIITGFISTILYMVFFNFEYYGYKSLIYNTCLYEIIPGFILNIIVTIVVSLLTSAPSTDVIEMFDTYNVKKED